MPRRGSCPGSRSSWIRPFSRSAGAANGCARCLKPFEEEFRVEVRELFAPGASDEADQYPVTEGHIDLEPMVRDAMVLGMPFSPLCRPDCLGLCERCGGGRNPGGGALGAGGGFPGGELGELEPGD